jgi:hypothetical protein
VPAEITAAAGAVAASMLRSAPAAQICAFMWRPLLVIRVGQLVSRAADHR